MLAPFEDKQMGGVGIPHRPSFQTERNDHLGNTAYRISMRNDKSLPPPTLTAASAVCPEELPPTAPPSSETSDFQWKFTHEFWRGKYHQHWVMTSFDKMAAFPT
jgi:hypothetical protein